MRAEGGGRAAPRREDTMAPVTTAAKVGRDVVYLVVGTGVLAFQRLQVERREVEAKVRNLLGPES
ncbi:hypothetical protein B7486_56920 [cyanobacterium TDX16]|nr:hypothetical protein B7486_56920 [cyanobacterium TDX16]